MLDHDGTDPPPGNPRDGFLRGFAIVILSSPVWAVSPSLY